jgi:hypothetical protein
MYADSDYPNVRASDSCPLCYLGKERGLVTCWTFYRERGLRYGNSEAELSIIRAEDDFVRSLDSASTKRDAAHSVGNKT